MTEQFQEKLELFRSEIQRTGEAEKRDRAEIERLKAALIASRTNYTRSKVESDRLEKKLELQSVRRANSKSRGAPYLTNIENELDESMKKMNVVLKEYEANLKAEQDVVMSMFHQIRDIPKNFGDEAMKEKTEELAQKKAAIQKVVDAQAEVAAKIKEECATDEERGKQLTATVDDFGKDLKAIVIKFEAEVRQRKKNHCRNK